MFGQNIFLLMGILLLLLLGSVAFGVLWTVLRAILFTVRQRRSQEAYRRQAVRPEEPTPRPVDTDMCELCGRPSTTRDYPDTAKKMCAACYEDFRWRAERTRHASC